MAKQQADLTPKNLFILELQKEIDEIYETLGQELAIMGELAVNEARLNGSYTDRTGNLRSSTGYVIAKNGEVITSGGFAKVVGQNNPKNVPVNGDVIGKNLATETAKQLSKDGFAMVIEAGMEYASHVADRGYDVLDSAELKVKEILETRFKSLGFGVGKSV